MITNVLMRETQEGQNQTETQKKRLDYVSSLWKLEKKELKSLLELPEGIQLLTSDLQNCYIIKLCCFKPSIGSS